MLITEDVPHAFEIFAVSVTVPIAFFVSVVWLQVVQLGSAIPVGDTDHVIVALQAKFAIE
jgi:hypothetical protein